MKLILTFMLMVSCVFGSAITPQSHRTVPYKYAINDESRDLKKASFFDLNEDGRLDSFEREVVELWNKSNKEVEPVQTFRCSWLHRYFDINGDGKMDKFEKEYMAKILFRWDNIKKGYTKDV